MTDLEQMAVIRIRSMEAEMRDLMDAVGLSPNAVFEEVGRNWYFQGITDVVEQMLCK